MQCDAINLVSSKNYTKANSGSSDDDDTTTKKRRKIRKYPKCFHMMAKKKMERLSFVLQKLPWQKEFQHFVPLSKKKSRKKKHHMTAFAFFAPSILLFRFSPFFLYVGTICILFFLPETRCLLLHKKECVLRKRNVFFRSAVRLNRPDKYKSQRQTTLRLFTNAEREKGNCNGRNGNFAKLKFDKMIR